MRDHQTSMRKAGIKISMTLYNTVCNMSKP